MSNVGIDMTGVFVLQAPVSRWPPPVYSRPLFALAGTDFRRGASFFAHAQKRPLPAWTGTDAGYIVFPTATHPVPFQ